MRKKLLVGSAVITAVSAVVQAQVTTLYRETFPYLPATTPASLGLPSTISSVSNGDRATFQGWEGYRSANGSGEFNDPDLAPRVSTNQLQLSTNVATAVTTLAPAETPVNSNPFTSIAGTTDGYAFFSPSVVGNVTQFTREYTFDIANASEVLWDDANSNVVPRRVLVHIQGQDPTQWWISNSTVSRTPTVNPATAPAGTVIPTVWIRQRIDLASTEWTRAVVTGGDNFSTTATSTGAVRLTGTVDAFGIWEDNPQAGNRYFDNYTINAAPSWNVNGSGTFSTGSNWRTGTVPGGIANSVIFGSQTSTGTTIASAPTVTLNSAVTLGSLVFNNSSSYSVTGTGSITLNNTVTAPTFGTWTTTGSSRINVFAGNHSVGVPVTLAGNLTVSTSPNTRLAVGTLTGSTRALSVSGGGTLAVDTLRVGTLSVATGSTVDLGRGRAVLSATSVSDVIALVTSGRLTSTATGQARDALATLAVLSNSVGGTSNLPFYSNFGGGAVVPSDVLVMYTYRGDTNLDGRVDGTDLGNIIEGLSGAGTGWAYGDSNYSPGGLVDLTDFAAFLASYNYFQANQSQVFTGGGSGEFGLVSGAVPEPGALGAVAATGGLLLRRRNRR